MVDELTRQTQLGVVNVNRDDRLSPAALRRVAAVGLVVQKTLERNEKE